MSTNEPQIETRSEQPYVGIRRTVTMQSIAGIADRIPDVFGWLARHGVDPVGAPFLKYDLIDMERELVIEAGVPVATPPDADDGEVFAAVLPAGRYATVTHIGEFDGLIDATADLLGWAAVRDLTWDSTETDTGTRWGCRLEIYLTNPALEPDPAKYQTQLAIRLADSA